MRRSNPSYFPDVNRARNGATGLPGAQAAIGAQSHLLTYRPWTAPGPIATTNQRHMP